MFTELKALPDPAGGRGSLMDAIDLIVPHQANQVMVAALAKDAGFPPDRSVSGSIPPSWRWTRERRGHAAHR